MNRLYGIGLTAASGALCGLAFPEPGLRSLAWVGLAPWLVALRRAGPWEAALQGAVWATLVSLVAGTWFPGAVIRYFEQTPFVALVLYGLTIFATGCIYYALFGVAYRAFAPFAPAARVLLAAAAWTGIELLRVRLPGLLPGAIGNPWGVLGYTQAACPAVIQIASVTGVYGVSFALVAANAGLAELVTTWRSLGRRHMVVLAIGLAPSALALAFGAIALVRATDRGSEEGVPVGIVQGNVAIAERWRLERQGENLDVYLRLTAEVARAGGGRLVIWPEAAMTFDVEAEPLYRRAIGLTLSALDIELLAGGPRALPGAEGRYANALFAFTSKGDVTGAYEKQRLIPWAEFDPVEAWSIQLRDFAGVNRYAPGRPSEPLETRAGRAGVLICQESMFGEWAGQRVAQGAEFLVNPANDSWVGDRRFALQQLDMAILRAVEQRRDLVRVSTAGPSGVIDAWGRPRVLTEPLVEGTASASVVARTSRTLYSRLGDTFALACLLATGLAGVLAARRAEPVRRVATR